GDMPSGEMPVDAKYKDWLMHCWLDVGDQSLMGADMDVQWAPNIDKPRNGFDVTLHTDSTDQARRWFEQLSEQGRQVMPFEETFWSPGFGALVDRFGVPWMVNRVPPADWKPGQGRSHRTRRAPHRPARCRDGLAPATAAPARHAEP